MRPIRINVKLTLSQPQQPLWLLGEASRTYNGSAIELDPTDSTTRLGIQRRKLYHQSYQAVLNYLRTVELPEGEA
jgi:hypothetical protein